MADEVKKNDLALPEGWDSSRISQKQVEEIMAHFRPHANGPQGFSPRICNGPDCTTRDSCPLFLQGLDLPVGRQCFVELNLIRVMMGAMARDLGASVDNVFDMMSIGSIALNNILIKRAMDILAREGIVIDSFRALTREGHPVFERKAHPSVGIVKEFQKINQMTQADLMATRKEKSKDEMRKRVSPSEIAEKLRQKLLAAQSAIKDGEAKLKEHFTGEVIEAEFEIKPESDKVEVDHGQQEEEDEEQVLVRDSRTGILRKAE